MSNFDQLEILTQTIIDRRGADPKESHVAKLIRKGPLKIAKKLGEEAVETAIAAASHDRGQVVYESCDLLFHLLVLWEAMNIPTEEIMAELKRREGQSGIAEKASRPKE